MGALSCVAIVTGAVCAAYGVLMAVLYPAGGFFLVWVAIGAALVALGQARRTGAWERLARWARRLVTGASVALLLAVAALCALVGSAAAAVPPAGLDCLVVLGAGLRPDGTPSEALTYRLDAALAYLEANPGTRCVVSGGQGVGEVRAEADAMADYLTEHGLDAGRVTREDRSRTTAENIRNSVGLLVPGESVGIVTNDFHLYRALRIAGRNGLPDAAGLAAPSNPLYLPQSALRECAAIVKDALVGNI
ncbi:YdcF family protein [Olsenella profusa]|uniref:YdcF family protein n=1 Tax=Olsenella profusa TaxID=138595 RepID=A0ABS2F2F3_9ACTN|nr:YdcF family protein [Olsenella profusa]MBM6775171.1 YdcF family protein [Olsenella profusa]